MPKEKEVLERIAQLGPLENVFLVADDGYSIPYIWFPEIGLRSLNIENNELAEAVSQYLWNAGVRRFKSGTEVWEALQKEKWTGWDTCADHRRTQQAMEELAERSKKVLKPVVQSGPPIDAGLTNVNV